MEKAESRNFENSHGPARLRRRFRQRSLGLDDALFVIVMFLIVSTIWFSEVRELFPRRKHTCKASLTVEERAAKILRENPLIG